MITKNNLPDLLEFLGFHKRAALYSKTMGAATLEVNFSQEEISYPAGLVVNQKQTCNLSANENFVVFECVHRLLEKGYKPEHIELEPTWKLGHGASGGRADVLIKGNDGKSLLIIECKTPGSEFKKAWNKTLQDGDQLFSYAQQISETQFLSLYASDFNSGVLTYTSHVIAHRDNDKYLADNPLFKNFKGVSDVKERFAVWRDTYKLDYTTKGIFEDNIQPYHIGKDKYSLADLQAISATDQQKKYHEFATILRQHNVSGRENAFDKLVNLFLCKLVDETENPHDLKFYWKGVAYDTHFELLDRLQQLYQSGMARFLGEDITYINQNDVNIALRFIRQNPDATQRAVWNLFVQQKFFTNNDFSLIDVHNEKLFYQNAEVLLKILQMWQDIRLTDSSGHNQFLGDLFEGFLDQGVKQSEGQYFTPMPICRFILMSLPLETLLKRRATPPKAIDYACGAGHFLTELARQLKPLLAPDAPLADYHRAMIGIEKEYRLSKVAKVSAFMYGQQEIKICYGDALIKQHAAFPEICDNSFDLLVANPPYSVKGFLETLAEAERAAYQLTATIGDLETANNIECFFIERAQQLLEAGGVAAIILPSSILSNGGKPYVKTRETLLQYFDFVAIAEFGSGTFGKTGTNTVTLFLRRKGTAPDSAAHYRERVAEWFADDDKQPIYRDAHLIDRYAAHVAIAAADYKTLLRGQPNAALRAHDTFSQYRKVFDTSSEIVNLKKQKGFKAKTQADQEAELGKRFLAFVQGIERDKLYYFVMASDQPNPVLILKSPTDSKAQKQFLGYDWSSAKGDEGIKLAKDVHGHHLTLLYDETDRRNPAKLNRCIADNFDGVLTEIPESLSEVASTARLVDLLDFSRVVFEKQFALSVKIKVATLSKWPSKALRDVAVFNPSKSDLKAVDLNTPVSFVEMASVSENGYILKTEIRRLGDLTKGSYTYFGENDIILAKITPCMENGKCALAKGLKNSIGMGSSEFHVIRADKSVVLSEFAFFFLNRPEIRSVAETNMTGSSGHRRVPESFYADLKIPLPPLDIQQKIVAECEVVDQEGEQARAKAFELGQLMIDVCDEARYLGTKKLGGIAHKVNDLVDPQTQLGSVFYIGLENIESHTGQLVGVTATLCADIKSTKVCFKPGDVLYGKLRPNLNKVHQAQEAGICSTDILVFRFADALHAKFYARYFLCNVFNQDVLRGVSGQQLPRTSWGHMQTILIPAPPESDLKRFVVKIEALEKKIAQAQAVIAGAAARKQAILQCYL